ncbi:MAG: type III-B CRISPR module-associated protein Cmr5 [Candidatus Brocadia sp.]
MSRLQKVEQKRAAEAWSCIQAVSEDIDNSKFKKEYRSIVMKLPALILTNGLGQTLAFLKSKGKNDDSNPEKRVYEDLQGWLLKTDLINLGRVTHDELIERIMAIDSTKYRFVTMESLSFLNWLKRFADAMLPKDGGN